MNSPVNFIFDARASSDLRRVCSSDGLQKGTESENVAVMVR